MQPLGLLQQGRPPGPEDDAASRDDEAASTDDERPLRCARCGAVVTSVAARISVGGAHEHTRANPGGWVHRFGCYARAPGCVTVGEPSSEFAWFPDASWTIAVCRTCRDHLGWRFSGTDGTFWGLLVAKLVEDV